MHRARGSAFRVVSASRINMDKWREVNDPYENKHAHDIAIEWKMNVNKIEFAVMILEIRFH